MPYIFTRRCGSINNRLHGKCRQICGVQGVVDSKYQFGFYNGFVWNSKIRHYAAAHFQEMRSKNSIQLRFQVSSPRPILGEIDFFRKGLDLQNMLSPRVSEVRSKLWLPPKHVHRTFVASGKHRYMQFCNVKSDSNLLGVYGVVGIVKKITLWSRNCLFYALL